MKKIFSILLAVVASVFFCNAAIARNVDTSKPLTMQQLPAGASTTECAAYPTCITITNQSSNAINIYVPSLDFSRTLYPMYMQPIISYDYAYKRVVLYDWTGYAFFDAYVPNHYDLVVTDFAGKLTAKVK